MSNEYPDYLRLVPDAPKTLAVPGAKLPLSMRIIIVACVMGVLGEVLQWREDRIPEIKPQGISELRETLNMSDLQLVQKLRELGYY